MATGADWLAGDAEREAVAGQLREHYAAGRLTMDEFRARLDAIYSASTARDLGRVTADLPAASAAWEGARPAGPRRLAGPRRRRWAAPAALLIFVSLVTASALALSSLPHGGLLVLALLLVVLPVMLLATLAGALIWVGRRAWRSGAWLEAVPLAMGMPWLGRLVWLARAVLVGRAFWRASERVSRPLRSRRGRYHRHGYAQYQRAARGPWHQARVGDLSGTTR
jgi:uncharacterized protein DUF1707